MDMYIHNIVLTINTLYESTKTLYKFTTYHIFIIPLVSSNDLYLKITITLLY